MHLVLSICVPLLFTSDFPNFFALCFLSIRALHAPSCSLLNTVYCLTYYKSVSFFMLFFAVFLHARLHNVFLIGCLSLGNSVTINWTFKTR